MGNVKYVLLSLLLIVVRFSVFISLARSVLRRKLCCPYGKYVSLASPLEPILVAALIYILFSRRRRRRPPLHPAKIFLWEMWYSEGLLQMFVVVPGLASSTL